MCHRGIARRIAQVATREDVQSTVLVRGRASADQRTSHHGWILGQGAFWAQLFIKHACSARACVRASASVCAYARACVRACVHACVRVIAGVRACVVLRACAGVRAGANGHISRALLATNGILHSETVFCTLWHGRVCFATQKECSFFGPKCVASVSQQRHAGQRPTLSSSALGTWRAR